MQILFLLFSILIRQVTFGQEDFKEKLKEIIADSASMFQKFKGEKRGTSELGEELFNTKDTLSGTMDNFISINRFYAEYVAFIEDSISLKEGRKIVVDWKNKLINTLGRGFQVFDKSFKNSWGQKKSGWYFVKGRVSVSVLLTQLSHNSTVYYIELMIFYEPPR